MCFDGSKHRVGFCRKRFGYSTAGQGAYGYGGGVGQQSATGWVFIGFSGSDLSNAIALVNGFGAAVVW
jgi:hypothetical protein